MPPAGPAGAGRQAGPAPGGGRGANPAAALYAEHCASCHGTDLAGGRAPSLFREQWLATVSDAQLTNSIRIGVPNTGMPAFASMLNDDQVWQLVQYLRLQSGVLRTRPTFVADPSGVVLKTERATVRLEVVADGLNTPWGLAFLPDGRLLVTERTVNGGTLRIIDNGVLSASIAGTPTVHVQQDAGMFDVEVHPKYTENGWIYLSYAERLPGYAPPPAPPAGDTAAAGRAGGRGGAVAPSMTTIVRGRINGRHAWVDQQIIFRAPANLYTTDGTHFGSRFIFDREGHLFFSIGERGVMQNAQDLSNPVGKIHRVNDDGSVPADNPFVSRADAVCSSAGSGGRRCGACRSTVTRVTGQEVIFDQFGRVRDVIEGPDGYLYLALQHATGAGTSYGLVAPSPGLVVRMVPVTR